MSVARVDWVNQLKKYFETSDAARVHTNNFNNAFDRNVRSDTRQLDEWNHGLRERNEIDKSTYKRYKSEYKKAFQAKVINARRLAMVRIFGDQDATRAIEMAIARQRGSGSDRNVKRAFDIALQGHDPYRELYTDNFDWNRASSEESKAHGKMIRQRFKQAYDHPRARETSRNKTQELQGNYDAAIQSLHQVRTRLANTDQTQR